MRCGPRPKDASSRLANGGAGKPGKASGKGELDRSCLLQGFAEFFVGGAEVFGVDAGFPGNGHEVGIAEPAREDVHVDVPCDPRTGGATEVDADIEASGMVGGEGRLYLLGKHHHFRERLIACTTQVSNVRVGNDHDVAGGVRKTITDEEVFFV